MRPEPEQHHSGLHGRHTTIRDKQRQQREGRRGAQDPACVQQTAVSERGDEPLSLAGQIAFLQGVRHQQEQQVYERHDGEQEQDPTSQ